MHRFISTHFSIKLLLEASRAVRQWAGGVDDRANSNIGKRRHALPLRSHVAVRLQIDNVALMMQYNPEDGRGRTKPVSQEDAVEELVQTVRNRSHRHACRHCST